MNNKQIVSLSEATQDFLYITRIADQYGEAVVLQDNQPKYVLIDVEHTPLIDMSEDEKIDFVAARILKRFKPAFQELAK